MTKLKDCTTCIYKHHHYQEIPPPPAQSYYSKSVVVVVCLPASPQGQAGSLGIGCLVTSLSALSTSEPQWTTHSAREGTRNGKEATFWNMTLVCYFPWFSQPDHWLWLKLRGEHVLFSRAWITSLLVSTCSMYISFTDIIFS